MYTVKLRSVNYGIFGSKVVGSFLCLFFFIFFFRYFEEEKNETIFTVIFFGFHAEKGRKKEKNADLLVNFGVGTIM